MEESKRFWKQVIIEEYYTKSDTGVVYYHWRFGGEPDTKWRTEWTAHKEIPFVEFAPLKTNK